MPDPEPHPSVAPASLELSRRLGTVRLEKQLARWLCGSLHLGRDSATDTGVFVWICTPAPERLQIEERFLSNGRLLAPLEHPALLAVRTAGREGDEFFVVTESSDGAPFPAVTNESDRTIAGWGRDLALALQAMHRSGLVVCDIHPANMRVEATGSIRWWVAGVDAVPR